METEIEKRWFEPGLRFQCTGCGQCCTSTSPSYVYLSEQDVDHLSHYFGLKREAFLKKYTRYDGQYSLLDKPNTYDCIFLKEKRCTVYEARPVQCRTFPWWPYNIGDEKQWQEAAVRCEGINHPEAPLVPTAHIEEQLMTYMDNLLHMCFDV
ncbi:MAG: YkgJ family cysteine cluster protein [Chlamydiia bacterium]|nr:YkgJ family cysteine cluster protein [Chlamydiia bacterium]